MIKVITDTTFADWHENDVRREVRNLQEDGYEVTDIRRLKRIKLGIFGKNLTEIIYKSIINIMETQVTSLEMSKKLEEAGFKTEVFFLWKTSAKKVFKNINHIVVNSVAHQVFKKSGNFYYIPAYTFQQLWEALPVIIKKRSFSIRKGLSDKKTILQFGLEASYKHNLSKSWCRTSAPDAAGEAILWCIENKYIKIN